MLLRLAKGVGATFRAHPLKANIGSGAVLGLLGDAVCQKLVERKPTMDWQRALSLVVFGAVYNGAICTVVYPHYMRLLPKWFHKSPLRQGVGSTIIDNGIHSPFFYVPTFFIMTDMIQGRSFVQALDTLREGYAECMITTWSVWVPLQFVNFGFVPPHFRPLVLCAGCLIYTVQIDYISGQSKVSTAQTAA